MLFHVLGVRYVVTVVTQHDAASTPNSRFHRQQYCMSVPTGCHGIPDNSLPFHFKTTDSEQFHYPPEAQDLIPSTADDTPDHGYVW